MIQEAQATIFPCFGGQLAQSEVSGAVEARKLDNIVLWEKRARTSWHHSPAEIFEPTNQRHNISLFWETGHIRSGAVENSIISCYGKSGRAPGG